jgi:asparagine synthase (glutamine-hydrolysing)
MKVMKARIHHESEFSGIFQLLIGEKKQMERIAGLICDDGCADRLHTQLVMEMCSAQAHRGAARGPRVVMMGSACLGVSSLRKSDVAEADCQPTHSGRSKLCVVFDGTIYNRATLRQELAKKKHLFRSTTDSHLVLHAFEEWREKCVMRLEGLFAFAVYDQTNDTLWLARDRYGVKPLYYTIQNRHIYFASEIKPLISKLAAVKASGQALLEWSVYRSVINPGELIEGICSVPPGHVVEFHEEQEAAPYCYYSPVAEVNEEAHRHYVNAPWQSVASELSDAVARSVDDCLTGDSPVGMLLSGGLDSSVMTALAKRKRKVIAVNVSSDDAKMDERGKAAQVADLLGVRLVSRPINREAFLRALPRVIYLTESPLTHIQCVAFHFSAQLAHENGVGVLLVGDAADTVLGGNWSRQRVLLSFGKLFGRLPARLRNAFADLSSSDCFIPVRPFYNPEGVDLLDRYARKLLRARCEEAYHFIADSIDRSILTTKLVHLVEDVSWYLQRGDRLGAAESVEYRTPFLDHRLVRMALNLPWRYQTRGLTDKWALRKVASAYLPHEIAYRKKVPWDLPLKSYLSPFACKSFFKQGVCLDLLRLDQKAIDALVTNYERHLQSFFNLVNLELWGRLFLLGQPVEEIEEFITESQADQK